MQEANGNTSFWLPLLEVEMKTRTGKNKTTLSGFKDDVLCTELYVVSESKKNASNASVHFNRKQQEIL